MVKNLTQIQKFSFEVSFSVFFLYLQPRNTERINVCLEAFCAADDDDDDNNNVVSSDGRLIKLQLKLYSFKWIFIQFQALDTHSTSIGCQINKHYTSQPMHSGWLWLKKVDSINKFNNTNNVYPKTKITSYIHRKIELNSNIFI